MNIAVDSVVLLPFPHPLGWLALTHDQLRAAQMRASEVLGPTRAQMPAAERRGAETRALLSPDDAALVLAIDASWLLTRAREGAIPHVRLGKYVRFSPDEIIEFGRRPKAANR